MKLKEKVFTILWQCSRIVTQTSQLTFFPKIVDTNEIGKLTEDSFALWEPGKNNITIGFDDGPEVQSTLDVYIGGPPTAVAAALHAKSGVWLIGEGDLGEWEKLHLGINEQSSNVTVPITL